MNGWQIFVVGGLDGIVLFAVLRIALIVAHNGIDRKWLFNEVLKFWSYVASFSLALTCMVSRAVEWGML